MSQVAHLRREPIPRVPHLRDGLIVAKVGIRAMREPLSYLALNSHHNPKAPIRPIPVKPPTIESPRQTSTIACLTSYLQQL
jgi:hypothetical protein